MVVFLNIVDENLKCVWKILLGDCGGIYIWYLFVKVIKKMLGLKICFLCSGVERI